MAAPANDIWYLASPISTAIGSMAGTNVEATLDGDEQPITIGAGTHSVWYLINTLLGSPAGEVQMWLTDHTFDAVLDVVSTPDVATFTSEGAVSAPFGGESGVVTFNVEEAVYYLIRVNGLAADDEGTFTLHWEGTPPPDPAWWAGSQCRPWSSDRVTDATYGVAVPRMIQANATELASVSRGADIAYVGTVKGLYVRPLPISGPDEETGAIQVEPDISAFDVTSVADEWVAYTVRRRVAGDWSWFLSFFKVSGGLVTSVFPSAEVDMTAAWEGGGSAAGAIRRAYICADQSRRTSGWSKGVVVYAKWVDVGVVDSVNWYGRAFSFENVGEMPTVSWGPETLVRAQQDPPDANPEYMTYDAIVVPRYTAGIAHDGATFLMADIAAGPQTPPLYDGRFRVNLTELEVGGTQGAPILTPTISNLDVLGPSVSEWREYTIITGINTDTDDGDRPAILTGAWDAGSTGGNVFGVAQQGVGLFPGDIRLISTIGTAVQDELILKGEGTVLCPYGWVSTTDRGAYLVASMQADADYGLVVHHFEFNVSGAFVPTCFERWTSSFTDIYFFDRGFALWDPRGAAEQTTFEKLASISNAAPEFMRWNMTPQPAGGGNVGWSVG